MYTGMNDSMDARVQCPYYIRHSRLKVPRGISHEIVCEPICSTERLGFDVEQSTKFDSRDEYKAYSKMFCCDMYETCPVYKAIFHNREDEDAKKHNKAKKNRKIQL